MHESVPNWHLWRYDLDYPVTSFKNLKYSSETKFNFGRMLQKRCRNLFHLTFVETKWLVKNLKHLCETKFNSGYNHCMNMFSDQHLWRRIFKKETSFVLISKFCPKIFWCIWLVFYGLKYIQSRSQWLDIYHLNINIFLIRSMSSLFQK